MANLITKKERKNVRADYLIRLFSVFLFISSLLGIFFLAYVIPYYISLRGKDLKVT
jgi:hypothetical protein